MWIMIFPILLIIAMVVCAYKFTRRSEYMGYQGEYEALLIAGAAIAMVIIGGILNLLGVFK